MYRYYISYFLFWHIPALGTFIYLMFFDGYVYNSWNWVIATPINMFLGEIWPIYWILNLIGVA